MGRQARRFAGQKTPRSEIGRHAPENGLGRRILSP
jgi:hypothetical protein